MRMMVPEDWHVNLLVIDVEDRLLQVLESWHWARTTADVILFEGSSGVAFLEARGYRVQHLASFSRGDYVAVRAQCLR